jgi:very-short-patch-repair endonuclease
VPLGGRFIVDFLAPAIRLVVEVDGSAHQHRRRADARRDAVLRKLGYRVVRVEVEDVMQRLPVVVQMLRQLTAGELQR